MLITADSPHCSICRRGAGSAPFTWVGWYPPPPLLRRPTRRHAPFSGGSSAGSGGTALRPWRHRMASAGRSGGQKTTTGVIRKCTTMSVFYTFCVHFAGYIDKLESIQLEIVGCSCFGRAYIHFFRKDLQQSSAGRVICHFGLFTINSPYLW